MTLSNAWLEQTFLNFNYIRLFFKLTSRAKKLVWLQPQQSFTRAAFDLTLYLMPASLKAGVRNLFIVEGHITEFVLTNGRQ